MATMMAMEDDDNKFCANCVLHNWKQPEDKTSLRPCPRCRMVLYCGEACRKEHRHKVHKHHCQFLADPAKCPESQHDAESCAICRPPAQTGKGKRRTAGRDKKRNPVSSSYECFIKDMHFVPGLASPHPFPVAGAKDDLLEKSIIVVQKLVHTFKQNPRVAKACSAELEEIERFLWNKRRAIWRHRKVYSHPQVVCVTLDFHQLRDLFQSVTINVKQGKVGKDASELWKIVRVVNSIVILIDVHRQLDALKNPIDTMPEQFRDLVKLALNNKLEFLDIAEDIINSLSTQVIPYEDIVKKLCGGKKRQNCSFCGVKIEVTEYFSISQYEKKCSSVMFSPLSLRKFRCASEDCHTKASSRNDDMMKLGLAAATACNERHGSCCDFCFQLCPIDKAHRILELVPREDVPGDFMYSVCYVDYGNSEVVSSQELMTWDTRLEALPEQAVECCLEDAPAPWRDEGGVTWTTKQLEAFQRTMRREELKVQLRAELWQDGDMRKARFEALVWLAGESLIQILKRQSAFADDLASWEPVDRESVLKRVRLSKSDLRQFGGGHPGGDLLHKYPIPTVLYNRAASRIKQEKYKEALDDVTAVLSIIPGQREAIVKCVECYLALGKLKEANAMLNLIKDPVTRNAYVAKVKEAEEQHSLILDLMNQELYVKAISQIILARTAYPKNWTLVLLHAECLAIQMKIKQAKRLLLSVYNDGIDENAHYLFVRGLCCYKKNKLSDASNKFNEAKSVASKNKLQFNRVLTKATSFELKSLAMIKVLEDAENEKRRGNKQKAVAHYTSALSLDTRNDKYMLQVHLCRAEVYKDIRKYNASIYDYEKVIEINTDCFEAWSGKGKVHMEMGNFKAAVDDFVEAFKLDGTPENRANLSRARRLLKGGKLTHYDVLGISPEATDDQIRNAYHNKAKEFHPDKHANADEEERRKLEAMMKNVTAAQRCLSDPLQKSQYDSKLDPEEDENLNEGITPHDVDVKISKKKVAEWLRKYQGN